MTKPVLVTEKEFLKGAEVFKGAEGLELRAAPLEEAALAQRVRESGCRAVVLGVDAYRGELYEALAQTARSPGGLIVRYGIGVDGIDKIQARAHGVTVVNTPVDIATSVAELTIFLIGSLLRNTPRLDARLRGGDFSPIRGRELHGKTALVIGAGKVGLKVMRRLHHGFGVRILASDVVGLEVLLDRNGITEQVFREEFGVEAYSTALDELLPQADLISLHVPLLPETRNLMDARRLSRLKPGAVVVNTARGGLVDETALFDALAEGRLAGAALDVYETEPYVPAAPDKDLRVLDNVVLTPHMGSDTREANARMAAACVGQIRHFLAGERDRLNLIVDGLSD